MVAIALHELDFACRISYCQEEHVHTYVCFFAVTDPACAFSAR